MKPRALTSISILACVALLVPGAAAAAGGPQSTKIAPGEHAVYACAWGYAPIARQHPLRTGGERLVVRHVSRLAPESVRVRFSHKVTVREDLGRFRTIVNHGHRTVHYVDDCPGGSAG